MQDLNVVISQERKGKKGKERQRREQGKQSGVTGSSARGDRRTGTEVKGQQQNKSEQALDVENAAQRLLGAVQNFPHTS